MLKNMLPSVKQTSFKGDFLSIIKYTWIERYGKHITRIFCVRRKREGCWHNYHGIATVIAHTAGKFGVLLLRLGTRLKQFELTQTPLEDYRDVHALVNRRFV